MYRGKGHETSEASPERRFAAAIKHSLSTN